MTAKEPVPIPPQVSLLRDEKVIMRLRRRYPSVFTSILSFVATGFLVGWGSTIRYVAQYPNYLGIIMNFLYLIIIAAASLFAFMALVGYLYV